MPINHEFFVALRKPLNNVNGQDRLPLVSTFTQQQVNSLNTITAVFDAFTGHDHCTDDLAYIMATCWRECGSELDLTIKEVGRGARKAYGKPAGPYGLIYYGRGPTQVTWLHGYQVAKDATGIDFVRYPDKMCDPKYGMVYMIDAMYAGRFTKRALRNYIIPGVKSTFAAFRECRRIVNGTDHADEVAYTAMAFQAALEVGYTRPEVSTLPANTVQRKQSQGLWASILRLFGRS